MFSEMGCKLETEKAICLLKCLFTKPIHCNKYLQLKFNNKRINHVANSSTKYSINKEG